MRSCSILVYFHRTEESERETWLMREKKENGIAYFGWEDGAIRVANWHTRPFFSAELFARFIFPLPFYVEEKKRKDKPCKKFSWKQLPKYLAHVTFPLFSLKLREKHPIISNICVWKTWKTYTIIINMSTCVYKIWLTKFKFYFYLLLLFTNLLYYFIYWIMYVYLFMHINIILNC